MSDEIEKQDDNDPKDFQEFVKSLSSEPVTVPTCKLCNSQHRQEAEAMAERGSSSMSIFRFLQQRGEDIKYSGVNNHINQHYKTQQKNDNLQVLAKQIKHWSPASRNDEQLLHRYITVMDIQYNHLAGLNENGDLPLAEQRKNMELMLKIAAVVQSYKDQLQKMQSALTPVEIFYSSLRRHVEIKLRNLTNPETKRTLFELMEQMEREVGEVSTEAKQEPK
jgi:hypothetical protein